ncbi:hypothetical protein K456DRAFT_1716776 [Colletotrichum gloeosporioides 23]|nr:hypothetical protein K456DRAFT_1716776 [Colletotrichum gloeosporioides 23]
MEGNYVQRSASHGSLRSSYRSRSRPPAGHSLPHRPLRSVTESAGLLPSPGPLESMLKTTTETGDIGIFTIKPIAPAATIHHCARSRPSIDASSIFRSESHSSIRTESKISRRRYGSDRDTNSEIISMYGSESNPSSGLSLRSPRLNQFRRSYSLTATAPRQLSRKVSSRTLQSPLGSGNLQRPRSPFPYPTRLKRPGVRPSSPAVTENGRVDYSRMVELDRISFRTVHGSYMPTYPRTRLAPPLSLRSDTNQSMPSLPYGNSKMAPLSQDGRSQSHRALLSSQWSGERSGTIRRQNSTDHSLRSSSLTSVIDMYCKQTPNSASAPIRTLRPAGSFYYDYTEGFETPETTDAAPTNEANTPLAPIPKRASSLVKALVLRDETKARLDAVVDISVKDSSDSSGDDGRGAAQGHADSRDISPSLAPFSFEKDGTSVPHPNDADGGKGYFNMMSLFADDSDASQSEHARNSARRELKDDAHEHSIVTGNERDQTRADVLTTRGRFDSIPPQDKVAKRSSGQGKLRKSPSAPAAVMSTSRQSSSQGGLAALLRSSVRNSVDPGLSDLAALVSSFERIAKSPFLRKEKGCSGMTDDANYGDSKYSDESKANTEELISATRQNTDQIDANSKAMALKPFFRGHRRNQAVACISTNSLRSETPTSIKSANATIICPEPISPARELRVRNSIPQLMKALPSIPNESPYMSPHASIRSTDDLGFPVEFSPFKLEILATPRSSPRITLKSTVEDHESFRASIEIETDSLDRSTDQKSVSSEVNINEDVPVSFRPYEQNSVDVGCATEPRGPTQSIRLRTSRDLLGMEVEENPSGTVRRYLSFSKDRPLSDLVEDPSEGIQAQVQDRKPRDGRVYQRKGRQFRLVTPNGRGARRANRPPYSSADTNSSDGYLHERYIPLAHPVDENLRPSSSIEDYDLSDTRSFSSDLSFIRPKIIRKKLSHLKIRMARSRLNLRGRNIGSTDSDATIRLQVQRGVSAPGQSKKVGKRMKGWFRRAVHIVIRRR